MMIQRKTTKYTVWIPYVIVACMMFSFTPIHTTYADTTDSYAELNAADDIALGENDFFDKTASLIVVNSEKTMQITNDHSKSDRGLEDLQEDDATTYDGETAIAETGVNAGTLIVIVLLACITVILLYSFVFKRKK